MLKRLHTSLNIIQQAHDNVERRLSQHILEKGLKNIEMDTSPRRCEFKSRPNHAFSMRV